MALQDSFQAAAGAQSTFAKGFSDALAQLASQEANEQAAFLQQFNTPQEAIQQLQNAGVSGLSDVLYGQYGYIPGSNLAHEGAAWQAYFGSAPQFTQQMVAQNQTLMDQQLALQRQGMQNDLSIAQMRMAADAAQRSAASSAAQAEAEGLTAGQQATQARWEAEFQREQEWRDQDIALAMAEEQGKLDEAAAEEKAQARQMMTFLIAMGVPPKQAKALAGLTQGQASAVVGQAQDVADDAQATATARAEKREKMWGLISDFDRNDFAKGMTKQDVFDQIKGDIENTYPNYTGLKESKVNARINKYINSHWSGWQKNVATTGGAATGKGPTRQQINASVRSGFDGAFADLNNYDDPNYDKNQASKYQFMHSRMVAAFKSDYPKYFKAHRQQVLRKIDAKLASRGIRPKKTPPRRPQGRPGK